MIKKILLVEDNGNIYNMLKDHLDDTIYKIIRVRAFDEACGADEEDSPFDCYVIDLQIHSYGLSLSQMTKYKNREGYAFIKEYLYNKENVVIENLKPKIIICSGFISAFEKEFGSEIEGLRLVEKKKGFELEVASLIEKICQNKK